MANITYAHTPVNGGLIKVMLEGRFVGVIRGQGTGFQYAPKSGAPGDVLPTIEAVKRSLEGDES